MTKRGLLQRTTTGRELDAIRWLEPSAPHMGLTSRAGERVQLVFMPCSQRFNKRARVRKPTCTPGRAGFRELGVLGAGVLCVALTLHLDALPPLCHNWSLL